MPVANVKTRWVAGNLNFYDKSENIIATWDGENRKLTIPSGSTLDVQGTATIVDSAFEAPDMALATGSILLGTANKAAALDVKADGKVLIGNGTTAAMMSLGTDVTMTNTGAVTIASNAVTTAKILNGAVTAAKLADGAGVAAVLASGLGGSDLIIKTDTATHTLVALNAAKARACLVVAVVTEAFATGDTSRTIITVGETDTPDKLWAATIFPNALALGTVLVGAFTNTLGKAITATSTAAAGTGTGAVSLTVIAIPTT